MERVIYYDQATGSMFLSDIHQEIPITAIKITQEEHDKILSKAVTQRIVVRSDGCIVIEDILYSSAELLERAQNAKISEINSMRDTTLSAGFEYDGQIFDSDEKSMQRIRSLVTKTLLDASFSATYITKDNQIIQLSAKQLCELNDAASAHESEAIFRARQLKDAVLAAASVEQVDAIVWN